MEILPLNERISETVPFGLGRQAVSPREYFRVEAVDGVL